MAGQVMTLRPNCPSPPLRKEVFWPIVSLTASHVGASSKSGCTGQVVGCSVAQILW